MTIEIQTLPFVTGLPDDGQTSIRWVRNGELLEGSSTKKGHDGVLNASSVQIQENVMVVHGNLKIVADNVDTMGSKVTHLENIIAQELDLVLVQKVAKNTEDIATLDAELKVTNIQVDASKLEIETITGELGLRVEESGTKTVFNDLIFLKTKVGHPENEDLNGNPLPGLESSGLTRKIETVTEHSLATKAELDQLKLDVESVDLTEINKSVNELRTEIGPTPAEPLTPKVYERLSSLESDMGTAQETISSIESAIGLDSRVIQDDVDVLQATVTAIDALLNDDPGGVIPRLTIVETTLTDSSTGVIKIQNDHTSQIAALETKVGPTGLSKELADVSTFVGYGTVPAPPTSVAGKLETLIALHNDTAASVQDLQVEVGNANTGLVGDVKTLKATVTAQGADIVDLKSRMTALEARVTALETP